MRTTVAFALVLLALLPCSRASSQDIGATCGEVYLSVDQSRYDPLIEAQPFTRFEFYLLLEIHFADCGHPEQQANNGFSGWEVQVSIPHDFVIVDRTLRPETSQNAGQDDNWIVSAGQNVLGLDAPFAVAVYGGMILVSDQKATLFLYGSEPSRFDPRAPGWLEALPTGECQNEDGSPSPCWRPFANDRVGGGGLCTYRPCPFIPSATETESWGAVKARY